MPHATKAEIFIETLAEMLAEERARKAARTLHMARAQAERFLRRTLGDDIEATPASQAATGLPLTV